MRTLFWAGESIDQFPNVKAYVDRIEEMGFVKRALEIPERDLVSRVKGDPELEARIMEGMKKAREEKEREKKEAVMGEKVGKV